MVDESNKQDTGKDAIAYLFRVGYLFRQLFEEDHETLLEFSRSVPLTPQQIRILFLLERHENITVNEIASRLNRASPTIVLQLNSMEELGYIKRVRSTKDRRQVLISLTDKGRELLDEIGPLKFMLLLKKINGLSKREKETLRDSLGNILDLLETFYDEQGIKMKPGFAREHAGLV